MLSQKSVCPVVCWATGKVKPAKFLEIVIFCQVFCGNFKRKLDSSLCYHKISVRTCFSVCISLIFRFAYCFCAMLLSVSHLNTVNIFCSLCYIPDVVCFRFFRKTTIIGHYNVFHGLIGFIGFLKTQSIYKFLCLRYWALC